MGFAPSMAPLLNFTLKTCVFIKGPSSEIDMQTELELNTSSITSFLETASRGSEVSETQFSLRTLNRPEPDQPRFKRRSPHLLTG